MITLLSLETDRDTDVSTPEYFISVSVRIEIVHITVSLATGWEGQLLKQVTDQTLCHSHTVMKT